LRVTGSSRGTGGGPPTGSSYVVLTRGPRGGPHTDSHTGSHTGFPYGVFTGFPHGVITRGPRGGPHTGGPSRGVLMPGPHTSSYRVLTRPGCLLMLLPPLHIRGLLMQMNCGFLLPIGRHFTRVTYCTGYGSFANPVDDLSIYTGDGVDLRRSYGYRLPLAPLPWTSLSRTSLSQSALLRSPLSRTVPFPVYTSLRIRALYPRL
jgi:hypothetical protein